MGCAVVFPAALSVGTALPPRVGAPSFRCVVSGGWWASAGVVRTASHSWSCGVRRGRAPPGVVRCLPGVGQCGSLCCGTSPLCVGPGARRCVIFPCVWVPVLSPSWPLGGSLLPCCVAPGALSLWAPVFHFAPFLAPLPECPLLSLALPLPVPSPFPVWWWRGGRGACGAPMAQPLGLGGLEPPAEGLGGVGGAEALDRVPEEGLPCRLRHDGLRGGLVGVGGGAGADLLEGVHHVHPFLSSRSPGPLYPAAELLQGGNTPPGEVRGGLGGGRLRARRPGMAGGQRGHAAVAGLAAPGGAGAAVAGAGAGGRVRAAGGTGGPVGLVGGGGGGHGAAVACLAVPEEAGAVVTGARGGGRVRAAGGTGSPVGLVGEGEVDMGRRWGAAGAGSRGVVFAPWGPGAGQVSG